MYIVDYKMDDGNGNIICVQPDIAALYSWTEADATGIHDTALMTACGDGNLDHIRLLLACQYGKVNLNASMMNSGWTALMYACQNGYLDAVKELFKHSETLEVPDRMNLDIRSYEGDTALIIACSFGENEKNNQHELIQFLLDNGADINITNFQGESAVTQACISNFEEGLQVLLKWPALTKETAKRAYLDIIDDTHVREETKRHIIRHYNKNLPKLRDLASKSLPLTTEEISELPPHIQEIIKHASKGGKRKRRITRRKKTKGKRTRKFKRHTKSR
jgi:hypothetical protein